jgi:hypothetical protein
MNPAETTSAPPSSTTVFAQKGKKLTMTKVTVQNESGASLVLSAEQHPKLWEAIQLAIGEIIGDALLTNSNERKRGRPPKQPQSIPEPPNPPAGDNAILT